MGTDMWTTVGRIKTQPTQITDSHETSTTGKELAVFDNKRFQFGDFEFNSDIPEEADIQRNYRLFSFLAGERGTTKPLIDPAKLVHITEMFLNWLNDEYEQYLEETGASPPRPADCFIGECGVFMTGHRSQVFYPINILREFDYDQPIWIEDNDPGIHWLLPHYVPDPSGRTYRAALGQCDIGGGKTESSRYFEFLDWAHENHWQFVIFGFSS